MQTQTQPLTFEPLYGWIQTGQIPPECVQDCSHPGDCSGDVAFWLDRLDFTTALEPVQQIARDYLEEYGAWEDCQSAPLETIAARILGLACNDMAEGDDWAGLVH